METKEFEKLKVIFVPKLGKVGLVNPGKGPDITIYSVERDSDGYDLLIINVMLCGSSLDGTYEVTGRAKERLLDEILNINFQVGSFRVIRDGEIVLKEPLTDIEAGWHLRDIRYKINRIYKNKNKSMETEKIFIPYYLEYVKCLEPVSNGNSPDIIFKAANGDLFYVSYEDGSIKCVMMRYGFPSWVLKEKTGESDNERKSLRSLGEVLLDKSFDNIDFKLSYGLKDYTDSIRKHEKNRFLLSVLNCLDMNFSHKSMITDEITNNWEDLKQFDTIGLSILIVVHLINSLTYL